MKQILQSLMHSPRRLAVTVFMLNMLWLLVPILQHICSLIVLALIALCFLYHGARAGFLCSLWAILPILAWSIGNPENFSDPLILASYVSLPLCALLLRQSGSWSALLLLNTGFALLMYLLLPWLAADFLEAQANTMRELAHNLFQNNPNAPTLPVMEIFTAKNYAFIYSNLIAWLTLFALVLGRYWQAVLDNPGGFGREFRSLRLPRAMALLLLGLWGIQLLLEQSQGTGGDNWYSYQPKIVGIPLVVAGLALVHALAMERRASFLLGLFYMALLFFLPTRFFLMLAALADSHWDFRSRLRNTDPEARPPNDHNSSRISHNPDHNTHSAEKPEEKEK